MHPCPCLLLLPFRSIIIVAQGVYARTSSRTSMAGEHCVICIIIRPFVMVSFSPSSSSTITALLLSLAMSLALQLSTAKQCRRADAILSGTKRATNGDKRVGQHRGGAEKARCTINECPGRHCATTKTAQCNRQHRTRHEMTHLAPTWGQGLVPIRKTGAMRNQL